MFSLEDYFAKWSCQQEAFSAGSLNLISALLVSPVLLAFSILSWSICPKFIKSLMMVLFSVCWRKSVATVFAGDSCIGIVCFVASVVTYTCYLDANCGCIPRNGNNSKNFVPRSLSLYYIIVCDIWMHDSWLRIHNLILQPWFQDLGACSRLSPLSSVGLSSTCWFSTYSFFWCPNHHLCKSTLNCSFTAWFGKKAVASLPTQTSQHRDWTNLNGNTTVDLKAIYPGLLATIRAYKNGKSPNKTYMYN